MKQFQFEVLYGLLAIGGGITRYFNSYNQTGQFGWKHFLTSTFISGFSGYMFALFGVSVGMSQPFLFIMAGVGGFMGEQAMKLLAEYVVKKIK